MSVITCVAALCASCDGEAPVAGHTSTSEADAAPTTLRVCTTGDYRPLSYRDPATGQYTGIDIDMANDLAAQLGRTATFVATTWRSLMTDMAAPGKCDLAVGGISKTPAREQLADFTQPYLRTGKTPLATAANADRFQSIEQINRHDVRVIENAAGTNEQFARQNFPNATLIIWPDNTTVFDQLLEGRADVMITDAIEAVYQAKRNPGLVAVHPDEPFTTDHKAYLLPKGSQLTERVNQWLAHALTDGTFSRFYTQWMR
ncbi:transporter substrate-binding domain-containing protein [Mycobacterium decipiens]|uniref:transporter substrate-binding domain-containing protein n=1 Tax=Mycobacterium decipiens TaxID=1430326 RepID=UPI0013FDF7B8|nr:transporter substrate-binding domain-containing protein [Mycobacterium decipiens]